MLDEKQSPADGGFEDYDVEAVNRAGKRQPLYAARRKIFPRRATGNFRRFKWDRHARHADDLLRHALAQMGTAVLMPPTSSF